MNRKASSVTRRIIVRIVGLIDSRSNNISWPDFLERAGARVMDRRQRIRVAAAAYSRDSSPPSQSMDPLETLETPLFVRYLARASPLRSLRGSCLQMYSCVPWLSGPPPPLLLPPLAPFELRRSSNRHATIVARENVLVSRYRIYSHHSPPPVYILPRKGHEIPGLFLYGRIAN